MEVRFFTNLDVTFSGTPSFILDMKFVPPVDSTIRIHKDMLPDSYFKKEPFLGKDFDLFGEDESMTDCCIQDVMYIVTPTKQWVELEVIFFPKTSSKT